MVNNYSGSGKSRLSTVLFRLYGVCLEDKGYFISIVIHLDDWTCPRFTLVVLEAISEDRCADTIPQKKKCLLLSMP